MTESPPEHAIWGIQKPEDFSWTVDCITASPDAWDIHVDENDTIYTFDTHLKPTIQPKKPPPGQKQNKMALTSSNLQIEVKTNSLTDFSLVKNLQRLRQK